MGIRSDYIDLAIGLAVVFFLSSLVVSGLNEGLQWFFRVRPKFLWAYLYDLVDSSRGKEEGGRMLPRGFGGVLGLWGRANDRRPTATSEGAKRAPNRPADPAAATRSASVNRRSARPRRRARMRPNRATSMVSMPTPITFASGRPGRRSAR